MATGCLGLLGLHSRIETPKAAHPFVLNSTLFGKDISHEVCIGGRQMYGKGWCMLILPISQGLCFQICLISFPVVHLLIIHLFSRHKADCKTFFCNGVILEEKPFYNIGYWTLERIKQRKKERLLEHALIVFSGPQILLKKKTNFSWWDIWSILKPL